MATANALLTDPAAAASPPRTRRLFYLSNLLFAMAVSFAVVTNERATPEDGLFLIALCLLCTLPLLSAVSYRGKHSLMLVFLAYYFASFALKDFSSLISGEPVMGPARDALFSSGEIGILLGAACFIAGYLAIGGMTPERSTGILSREWSPAAMRVLGIAFWVTGFLVTTMWQFGIADRHSGVTFSHSLGGFIGLLRMLQPLGTLVLIYLFLTTRSKFSLLVMLATMCADFALGFLGDSKEIAVRGPLLYLFSVVILRERIPVIQGTLFILAAAVTFNLFAAYRIEVHSRDESRGAALHNLDARLGSITGKDLSFNERFSSGLDYFAARIDLKQSVELIMERTGKSEKFQHGRTIEPLLYIFIPRFILPDKPDSSMAGLLFNREFGISESPDTYISTSQVGELYWNFGWPGLVTGMVIIGGVMGYIACALRLDTLQTLPRFLLLLLTVYLLSLRFETALAQVYAVWARAALLLIVMNYFIPKARNAPAG